MEQQIINGIIKSLSNVYNMIMFLKKEKDGKEVFIIFEESLPGWHTIKNIIVRDNEQTSMVEKTRYKEL